MDGRKDTIDLLVVRGVGTREHLEKQTTRHLEKLLDESLLAGIRAEALQDPEVVRSQQRIREIDEQSRRSFEEYQFKLIFSTAVEGNVATDNTANREIIRNWLDEAKGDTGISLQWFLNVLKENPNLAQQLSWQSADVLDPTKRRHRERNQEAENRSVFDAFCRENRFSLVDANFHLAKCVLGDFDQYSLAQAVQSNALVLAPASPAELQQFRTEAQQERQEYLLNRASPEELRNAARQESEQRRIQAQREETERQIAARAQIDSTQGYTVLPEVNQHGERIDAAYLKNLATDVYRNYLRKYGATAITARLNGR
jgi:hypothetical protein